MKLAFGFLLMAASFPKMLFDVATGREPITWPGPFPYNPKRSWSHNLKDWTVQHVHDDGEFWTKFWAFAAYFQLAVSLAILATWLWRAL